MKKMKLGSIILYIISALFVCVYGMFEITPQVLLSELGRVFLLCGSCLSLYVAGLLFSKYKENNKAMKINLYIFFALYLLLFVTLTLFDPMWGRNGLGIANWSKELLNRYINESFNIIPFKTIIEYFRSFNGLLDTLTIMFNLFGNLVACMPLAFFLPMLFKKQNNIKTFCLTMIGIVISIELLQFITMSGSCDIDDLILNVAGAVLMYGILKIKPVNDLIKNIFLLEKNKIKKKDLILIGFSIIIVICAMSVVIKLRSKTFNNNYNEYMEQYNFKIEIVDESETSASALEKFYEDEYHEYYFGSIKSDKMYVLINDNEKYLIKDLLNNNPTKYKVTITKLQQAGLNFITQNKYKDLVLKGNGNVRFDIEIEDESILKIGYGTSRSNINSQKPEESTYENQFFLVPLQQGNTNFKIKIINNEDNSIATKNYKVTIDEKLQLEYKEI